MTRVKICGITNREDALAAIEAGAHAIGFNFYSKSPRFIDPAAAAEIVSQLPRVVDTVGVFVNETNPEKIREIASIVKLTAIQLHGDETPDYCAQLSDWRVIKALRVDESFDPKHVRRYSVAAVLLDGPAGNNFGGRGIAFDWSVAKEATRHARIILAGGLGPENVGEAIRAVQPYAVDVASGVERGPGVKDHERIAAFIAAVREADGSKFEVREVQSSKCEVESSK